MDSKKDGKKDAEEERKEERKKIDNYLQGLGQPPDYLGILLFLIIIGTGIIISGLIMFLTNDSIMGAACYSEIDMPAYHVLEAGDLNNSSMAGILLDNILHFNVTRDVKILLSDGAFSDNSIIEGNYYTLVPIKKGDVITRDMLIKLPGTALNENISLSQNNFSIIGIPATSSQVLDGGILAGDIVDIKMMPTNSSLNTTTFGSLPVMDIKKLVDNNTDEPYLLIVAIGRSDVDRFYESMNGANLWIIKNMTV
jgi:hypothetical protein